MGKIKVIALFGPSGSGKDAIQKYLVSEIPNKLYGIVSCTTRPMRDYEKDGVDYYFLTLEEFGEKVLNGSMLEATSFRDWFYGTPIESLNPDKINVGVFNIQGIECLLKDDRLDVYPIYIICEDKTRLQRCLDRVMVPDCEEICRRYLADLQDFEDIPFEYYTHYNGEKVDLSWIIHDLDRLGILSNID